MLPDRLVAGLGQFAKLEPAEITPFEIETTLQDDPPHAAGPHGAQDLPTPCWAKSHDS